ncbi:hypothetical protein GIB67_037083 [Kingdonia uniflora]|uniref:Uncharacterized protein n=1 Tax=Kingdonia uniflora TaxID=39325 RepID=A0A7J7LHQ0_9MAGN|nr:hypothetical protein GIB67_037083 [Kingdonia uniflora]
MLKGSYTLVRDLFLFCYYSWLGSALTPAHFPKKRGEEPAESLFMKELKKRGMTPTSILEESNKGKSMYELDQEMDLNEDDRGFSKKKVVPTDFEKAPSNQREISMALNSEGLEGLVPRAKLLLTLGGTFFLGFWPLILITVTVFAALYFFFGPTFIHDASKTSIILPPYIDPYVLLEEDRLSRTPFVK